ncbi:ras-related protein Rab-32B-like isoform X1 [Eriocheir sinensis]|uniref:ras-related protein Rab-32B-like isoform X1 n=1 Tax=Eriocheir sinensis TaxID=95602 RepID=UPI0021C6F51C|nr:ras-related protein Rab-32B-like isoform X1 [Eriocheir sinensis]
MTAVAPVEHSTVPRELQFKVLVIGEFGVGKTAVIRRYTEGHFSPYYKLTIGVDFAVKTLDWDAKTKVTVQLWDIAGHERFGHMTRVYYKYAVAAVVVFDLSRPPTFDAVLKWVSDIREKVTLGDGRPLPVLLLANKCDIDSITIHPDVISNFCKQHHIDAWFLTSAKEDINIGDAMKWLVGRILEVRSNSLGPAPIVRTLAPEDPPEKTPTYCCR